nr:hypothetical protein [uncultured bacterium]
MRGPGKSNAAVPAHNGPTIANKIKADRQIPRDTIPGSLPLFVSNSMPAASGPVV